MLAPDVQQQTASLLSRRSPGACPLQHHQTPPPTLALLAGALLAAGLIAVGYSAGPTGSDLRLQERWERFQQRQELQQQHHQQMHLQPQERPVTFEHRRQRKQESHGWSGPESTGSIPKVLHQIYIGSEGDSAEGPVHHLPWIRGCRYIHTPAAGWQYMYWNASSAQAVLAEHVPWVLPTYNKLTRLNEKADLVRYAVLHKYGGLYLDSDVECWRDGSDMLEAADVVVQGSWEEEGCASAMLASRPGEAVWEAALRLSVGRQAGHGADTALASIQRTGPILLADAFESLGVLRNASRMLAGKGLNRRLFQEDYVLGSTRYKFYTAGSWFTPCLFWQDDCKALVLEQRAEGAADLSRLVGMHRYSGSWLRSRPRLDERAKHLICRDYIVTAQ